MKRGLLSGEDWQMQVHRGLRVVLLCTLHGLVGRREWLDEVILGGQVCECITKITGFSLVNDKIL